MRGYPRCNFDAFDAAATDLRGRGWEIVSPADIDRANGVNPDKFPEGYFDTCGFDMRDIIRRDIEAVISTDCTILLPKWEKSVGANAEVAVAKWCEREILLYPDLVKLEDESILLEAQRLTFGDRNNQYGPPDQDFMRIAAMWGALKGVEFTPQDVAMFQICVKLSRQTHQNKRDNWVDMAGYAGCGSRCRVCPTK